MASSSKLIVLAPRALLPGYAEPGPATIEVDLESGKITAVHEKLRRTLGSEDTHLEVPEDQVLLPGLIECVQPHPSAECRYAKR